MIIQQQVLLLNKIIFNIYIIYLLINNEELINNFEFLKIKMYIYADNSFNQISTLTFLIYEKYKFNILGRIIQLI